MANSSGIVVEGLAEFRAAVRASAVKMPVEFAKGLKAAGLPILAEIRATAPRRTGALAGSFTTAVRGARADIVSRVAYAGGSEWGVRGRWAGFPGSPPRFVVPAVESKADEVGLILMNELREIFEIFGWAHA